VGIPTQFEVRYPINSCLVNTYPPALDSRAFPRKTVGPHRHSLEGSTRDCPVHSATRAGRTTVDLVDDTKPLSSEYGKHKTVKANMANVRQSRPDYGLSFQVKGIEIF